jgi:hypothetical protein
MAGLLKAQPQRNSKALSKKRSAYDPLPHLHYIWRCDFPRTGRIGGRALIIDADGQLFGQHIAADRSIVEALRGTSRDTGPQIKAIEIALTCGVGPRIIWRSRSWPLGPASEVYLHRDARRPVHQPEGAGHSLGLEGSWHGVMNAARERSVW